MKKTAIAITFVLAGSLLLGTLYYKLTPINFTKQAIRAAGGALMLVIMRNDLKERDDLTSEYFHGAKVFENANWAILELGSTIAQTHTVARLTSAQQAFPGRIPFVYQSSSHPRLRELVSTYKIDTLVSSAANDYEAIIRLGQWLGAQWDHGADKVPGTLSKPDPVDIIEHGRGGQKYWCEVAAKVAVQAASALQIPARLAMLSRDGYTFEHGIAEFWSNTFRKWIMVDTDFNLIYTHDSIPLSVFELCRGAGLSNRVLEPGIVELGHHKPSLPRIDLLPYFQYAFIDLRADWLDRKLGKASPVGGDLNTWRTQRNATSAILSISRKVDTDSLFNWPVNTILWAMPFQYDMSDSISLGYGIYAPYFTSISITVNGQLAQPETDVPPGIISIALASSDTFNIITSLRTGTWQPAVNDTLVLVRLSNAL